MANKILFISQKNKKKQKTGLIIHPKIKQLFRMGINCKNVKWEVLS